MKTGKINTIIPSRMGSNRVPMKGMRLLNGKTLIEYTLASIKESKYFSENIYINSDGELWSKIAQEHGVNFYHRKNELATSQSMIDDYLYDFIMNEPSDYLVVITPTAPFVEGKHLDEAWEQYANSNKNSLITAEEIQTHCFFEGKPLNLSTQGNLPRSQDLSPVIALNFSIAIYDCEFFKNQYEKHGYAVLTGDIENYILDGFAAIDIDEEKDFILAELASRFQEEKGNYKPKYSEFVSHIVNSNVDTRT